VIYEVSYYNYPQSNPEYAVPAIGAGEEAAAEARFLSVYELLDENWEVTITFFEEEEGALDAPATKALTAPTKVLSWSIDPPSTSIRAIVDNTAIQGKITFKGTWTKRFDQRRFDFRMNDETIKIDGDVTTIGDNYYGPINFIPDTRVWLESNFIVNVESQPVVAGIPSLNKTITTFQRKQTVLNNWDANRRRLLQLRDNPKRKEQTDADKFRTIANS
jgi:hypothetical protein